MNPYPRQRWILLAVLAWSLAGCQVGGAPAPQPTALPTAAASRGTIVVVTPATLSPASGGVATVGTPAATPPTSTASAATTTPHAFTPLCRALGHPSDWFNRLYFQGRGYARIVSVGAFRGTPVIVPEGAPPFALGETVGRVFAPWQAGYAASARTYAPPGTPIRAAQGVPPEQVLAVTFGATTDLFCALDPAPTLAATRVVRGRVEREVPLPPCEFSRCLPTGVAQENVLGVVEVTVREVWQGVPPTAGPLTVVALRNAREMRLALGEEVVLLVRPQEALEDYQPVLGLPSRAAPIWVADLLGQYRVEGDRLRWAGDNATTVSLAAFRAGLAETFAGVTPSDPPTPSSRP